MSSLSGQNLNATTRELNELAGHHQLMQRAGDIVWQALDGELNYRHSGVPIEVYRGIAIYRETEHGDWREPLWARTGPGPLDFEMESSMDRMHAAIDSHWSRSN